MMMDKENRKRLEALGGWLFIFAWMGIVGSIALLANGHTFGSVAPLGIFGVLLLAANLALNWRLKHAATQELSKTFPSMMSTEEFAECVVRDRAAICRIDIAKFKRFYYEQLCRGFIEAGISASKYTGLLNAGLSSYCPKCEERMTGEQLGFLLMAQEFGGYIGSGAIRASRFARGQCPNCASTQIVLSWRPQEAAREP
jgi:hypothetical protein